MNALPLVLGLLYIPIVAVSIDCMVLFIDLATQGIRALEFSMDKK